MNGGRLCKHGQWRNYAYNNQERRKEGGIKCKGARCTEGIKLRELILVASYPLSQPWVCLTGNNYKGSHGEKNGQDRKQWETKPPRNMPDRGSECSLFSFFAVSADAEENRFSNWSLPVSTVQMKFSSFRCSRERRDNCALSLSLSLLHYHRWKMLIVDVTIFFDKISHSRSVR